MISFVCYGKEEALHTSYQQVPARRNAGSSHPASFHAAGTGFLVYVHYHAGVHPHHRHAHLHRPIRLRRPKL